VEDNAMDIAVVTGTSSGIGYATSLHLARKGYRVFAGMRNLAKAAARSPTSHRWRG
jgi:NAD(P)-dependent dehydrogenase (short-subunit alcohol dehydrogenase family)